MPGQETLHRFSAIARRLLGEDAVRAIVEVGARDCQDTLGFHAQFPQARILAFECNPSTLPTCRAAVAGIGEIELIEKAVTDHQGEVVFYPVDEARSRSGTTGENPGASSLYRASGKYPLEHYAQKEIRVDAVTLEGVMEARSVDSLDLLWMDVQGAELLVLAGLGSRIGDVRLIHLEVEFFEVYEGQPLYPEIDAFLSQKGFRCVGFSSYHHFFGDAVYARADCAQALSPAELAREFPFLARNRRKWRRHSAKRAIRRWFGLPEWPQPPAR